MSAALPESSGAAEVSGPAPARPSDPAESSAPAGAPAAEAVLEVRDLRTYFFTYDGIVRALDGVSLRLGRGETLGLVGETGCGKSVTALSILRLIPDPPGLIVGGHAYFRGADLLWGIGSEASFRPVGSSGRVKIRRSFHRIKAAAERMSAVRGRGIAMIFQEPTQAMNPIFSIANQVQEALLLHRGPDIVLGLLQAAKPSDPAVEEALLALAAAADARRREEIPAAAKRLGVVARLPTIGTQARYTAMDAMEAGEPSLPALRRVVARLHLGSFQRGHLVHLSKLYALQRRLEATFLAEMGAGAYRAGERSRLRSTILASRITNFYYGFWGVRRVARRPLEEELFWRAVQQLEGVAIANPVRVARGYPYELSGGMLQRVMIAMALASEPDILFADEPTTALDVTIQAQILELIQELKQRVGTAVLLITHDLAVIAEVADRVCVMYAGRIIESGPVRELFRRPLHPYTQGLLASIPRLDRPDRELTSIPGSVPNLIRPPSGCRFRPRCPHAMPVCAGEIPPMTDEGRGHEVACYLYKGPVASR